MKSKTFPVIGCDAGGTMTDIFLLDEEGNFSIGKASTTPQDESIGFMESLNDAFETFGINFEKVDKTFLRDTRVAVYSGTTMINAILNRTGLKTGLIVTAGFEDILIQERGVQCWSGYSYSDRFHKQSHHHNIPLVPRRLIKGVTERVDLLGRVVIPVYDEEIKNALRELLDEGVEGIGVCFLWSFMNPSHEKRVTELSKEIFKECRKEVPIYLSSEVAPILAEHARVNSVAIQAATSEVVRGSLFRIEEKLKNKGYSASLFITTAGGGMVNIRYPKLVESVVSGPVGGLMGTKYLASQIGLGDYVFATDLGGTTFDAGIITGGMPFADREIHVARFILNLPILTMDNIGAGLGSFLTVSERKQLMVGPGSAGSEPGPVSYDKGNEIPTLMDAHLILGHLNKDYYLGGKVKLNVEKAKECLREKVAVPLGLDVYQAAEGAIRLLNVNLQEAVQRTLSSRGLHPADYYCMAYGGAGPVEVCFYTEGIPFKGVFTVPFAAAFSAFGLLTDYTHKYQKSTMLMIPPNADDNTKMGVGMKLNEEWDNLEKEAREEMEKVGIPWESVQVQPIVYFRYGFQLNDVETPSPVKRIKTPEDVDKLIGAFESLYEKAYTRIAKFPQAGYVILNLGLIASMPLQKPQIKKYELQGKTAPKEAYKGKRKVCWDGKWQEIDTWEMDLLEAGNEVEGFSIIEAPSTTLVLPKGKKVRIDEWKLFWIQDIPK